MEERKGSVGREEKKKSEKSQWATIPNAIFIFDVLFIFIVV